MKRLIAWSAATAASCLLVSTASAHLDLLAPEVAYPAGNQKAGPCGAGDDPGSGARTTFAPGATITVRVDETIRHPGYFRIAFDDDGVDGFVDPLNAQDIYNVAEGTNGVVLIDHWLQQPCNDPAGNCPNPDAPLERPLDTTVYETTVTLPDIECDNCTLQVLQIMTDKNPSGDFVPSAQGTPNDIYYRCANIALVPGGDPGDPGDEEDPVDPGDEEDPGDPEDPTDEDDVDPMSGPVGGGCSTGGGASGAGLLLVGLGLAAVRRRRS